MIEQYKNEIEKLKNILSRIGGNSSSVKMKKFAIGQKIELFEDIVKEMELIQEELV
jgi:hypothetical protein|tara:strand:- start:101 stop:268 length:168 start_codon:yes stop_codon:yes gene_type:complete